MCGWPCTLHIRARDVLHLVKDNRRYDPKTIGVMTAAFERVCQSAPSQNDDVRRKVALIILRYVDRGEHDPVRLSDRALRELASVGWLSATG
jgi:hypothetical protein